MSAPNTIPADVQSKVRLAEEVKDEEKLYRFGGVLYPSIMCPEENLQQLQQLEGREDDVMLVAYPKCGFNWMVGVLKKIISEATGVKDESKMPPIIEFFGPDARKALSEAPSPRFMGTHMHPDNIPPSFYTNKTKMLVIFRNPKDTLVSYYHFCNNNPVLPSVKSWDQFYCDFMKGDVAWGSYFDHILAWDKRMDDPTVKVVTYEELKQDLPAGVRQISSFFGFNLTETQVEKISQGSTFSAMKQNSGLGHMENVIFRKGEVGDWKNHFSPEQSRRMDQVFKEQLSGTRLGKKFNYDKYCQ